MAILKLLFLSTFILILEIAISFHLTFVRNKRVEGNRNVIIAISFYFLQKWVA